MDVDTILSALNRHEVRYLLIGGVNFLLHHKPVLTFDTDVWIEDSPENRTRVAQALVELGAEWGPSEKEWRAVTADPVWLEAPGHVLSDDKIRRFGYLSIRQGIKPFRRVHGRFDRWQNRHRDPIPRPFG